MSNNRYTEVTYTSDGEVNQPVSKRRRDDCLALTAAQSSIHNAMAHPEIGAAVTNRTVGTAASNHVIMSPPNEQRTPTKKDSQLGAAHENMMTTTKENGSRTHHKFTAGYQQDYQSLSLNGGEAAKDTMKLSLQKRLNTSSTEVK